MLLITRRWYIYFIFSYYICYGLWIIIKNLKDKNLTKALKNILLYLIIVIIFFSITIFPFFLNVIKSNFGFAYSYYLTGGFSSELKSQISHIGYLPALLMIIGIIYGIMKKEYRLLTFLSILEYFLIILLFTRIQNMGLHHSLLLVPTYIYFTYLFITFTSKKKLLCMFTIIICITNFSLGLSNYNNNLFAKVPLKTKKEEDYKQIEKISKWLKENINENNKAYMITHNNTHNPDKFRNFYMPDKTISNFLPYGSAILGTHMFPVDLFDATYIITTSPFEPVSIEESYNKVFNELVQLGKFELIKTFNMNNNINMLIYKRVKPVDLIETKMYLDEISNKTKEFKNLYEDVIVEYIRDNNLN